MPKRSTYKALLKMKNKSKHSDYKRGLWAEYVAALYLFIKGYKILEHRYKTPLGEIDLIVQKGKLLIAVEVKLRASTEAALGAITPKARQRIINTIKWYMSQNPHKHFDTIRMDMIAISLFSIHHLDNAWQETHT